MGGYADKQAARNIKQKAVQEYGLNLTVLRDSKEPKQLSLFETPSTESTVPKRRKQTARKSKRSVPGKGGSAVKPVLSEYTECEFCRIPRFLIGGVSTTAQ